ncbi:MAG: hypothetical protein IJ080_02480, partial [Oscillospiraceae bacterium]|nr:hypothetical protein [Oscillospiraceae bacterium]
MEKKKVTPRAVNSMFFSAVICSAMLIIITIVLGWDTWTVPLLLLSSAVAVTTHTMRRPSDNVRMYMYASLFIMQLYYYCTNVKSIYDCTPVVVMAIAIMTLSDNRILLHITMGVGIYGMAYNLLDANIFTRHITFVYSFYTLLHFGAVITVTIASNALIISRRRQEAEYEDRLRVLEKENKSATDFLANVSHEIRTPINVVIGMTNVMLDSESDPAKRENLISVNEAGNRIAWQISDILDYSDIDMARLSKAEDRFNITSLVNDIVTEDLRRYILINRVNLRQLAEDTGLSYHLLYKSIKDKR